MFHERVNLFLLACLSEDFDESDVSALRAAVESISRSWPWTVAPPAFVDERDDSSCNAPEDEPIRTVGAVLTVTAEGGTYVSRTEVAAFIDALAAFSSERHLDMELQLGRKFAGTIRAGVTDALVRDALLGTW